MLVVVEEDVSGVEMWIDDVEKNLVGDLGGWLLAWCCIGSPWPWYSG